MDMLQIIILFTFFTAVFVATVINVIDYLNEKKRQERLEQRRIELKRKRNIEFFVRQGEWLENV